MTRTPLLTALAVFAFASTLAGCGSTTQARDVEASGFLGDYSALTEGEGDQALLRHVDESADFSQYTAVYIEPVEIWAGVESELRAAPEEDRQALAEYFHAALVRELGGAYQMAGGRGPGTLVIRTALTDGSESSVGLDLLTTVLPAGRVLSILSSLATGTHTFVGDASAEVEFSDGTSGAVLAQAVDRRAGRKTLAGSTDAWGDAKGACDAWAEQISEWLAARRAGN